MRAAKYFDSKMLLSLEDVLFHDIVQENTRYQYCLINESMKTFYISDSVSVAGVIAKLRLIVKGADYPLIAHQVQGLASTSNMVDWVMAVFSHGTRTDQVVDVMEGFGFARQYRENPYGVNGIENIAVYRAFCARDNISVYFTSVNKVTNKRCMEAVKRILNRHLDIISAQGRGKFAAASQAITRRIEHTHQAEWVVKEIGKENLTTLSTFRKHTAELNWNEAIRFANDYK